MTSLLSSQGQTIDLPLYYLERATKSGFVKVVVLEDDKAKKMLDDEKTKDDVKVLNTKWKVLTWKEQTEITKASTVYNPVDGVQDIDFFKYRDLRIKKCMVGWDMVDDKNVPVPLESNTIDMLPADIVISLISKYDSETSLTEEEQKN